MVISSRRVAPVVVAMLLSAGAASADPATVAAGKLVDQQFAEWKASLDTGNEKPSAVFAPDARLALTGGLGMADETTPAIHASEVFGMGVTIRTVVHDVRVGTSADGKAEWVFFTATVTLDGPGTMDLNVRGSELISKHGDKWLVDGGALSVGHADGPVNAAAAAGKLGALQPLGDANDGDKTLLAAFTDLITKGFDDTAAAAKTFVTVGSGPGELTNGGKGIAPYFKKAWAGHATIDGPLVAVTAANKTTGYVLANVSLPGGTKAKPYTLPFRMFVVFDKTPAGTWTAVHMHLAVPAPH